MFMYKYAYDVYVIKTKWLQNVFKNYKKKKIFLLSI